MMQSLTALLQNLIVRISAPQHPGPHTPARYYPAPAPQRQFSSPTLQYQRHTMEGFDSFHLILPTAAGLNEVADRDLTHVVLICMLHVEMYLNHHCSP